MLLHLVPGKEYEKYFRFILDLSVVAIIFVPVLAGGLPGTGNVEDASLQAESVLAEEVNDFEENYNAHLQNIQENIAKKMNGEGTAE
jgi:hypothetical protein